MSILLGLQIVHDRGLRMQFRLKPLLASFISALMLAGSFLALAPVAEAAQPPFEPDPNSRGCVTFYDAAGNVVTSGSITDSPMTAYAQASSRGRTVDNTATLFGFAARRA